jgi:hypothetical protein
MRGNSLTKCGATTTGGEHFVPVVRYSGQAAYSDLVLLQVCKVFFVANFEKLKN